ncbi:GTP cyclohydrolase II [Virgifigura deserti]|uniref:GTP cyclohydrolase II n=1 Tax=Virgifigura deserti TaxID=2268457 RepID=UPI003CCC059C
MSPSETVVSEAALLVAVDRATAELRRGGTILVHQDGTAMLVQAAETVSDESLLHLKALSREIPILAVTAQRAAGLGLEAGDGVAGIVLLALEDAVTAGRLRQLADPTVDVPGDAPLPDWAEIPPAARGIAKAAVELTKLARLLPAAVISPFDGAPPRDLLSVSAREIAAYETAAAHSLQAVGEAQVPLADAENTRIVAFRPGDGGVEHLAIVIGTPAPDAPVLTRLHSECFTGDLLGSLRCDCGDQLRGAIAEIARQGSGLLLYLAQEGRGIGLVNKLRAYQLQDQGADTFEANQQLGFDADERIYLPAAEMLRRLGFHQVRLMTNNPEKVTGLARCGISVVERVPHVFPANGHNDRYLRTKATKFGHLF